MANLNRKYIKLILIITLLVVLVLAVIGCADFEQWAPELPEETTEKEVPPPTTITTEDRAILAVQEHLLGQVGSYQAKLYLADFYTACDDWSAESELFKDGTRAWCVVVNITRLEWLEERPHWRQASWFVFQDGKVMPSDRFQANALRIEADLQELSLQPES